MSHHNSISVRSIRLSSPCRHVHEFCDDACPNPKLTCHKVGNLQSKQCGPPSCNMPIAGVPKFNGLLDSLTYEERPCRLQFELALTENFSRLPYTGDLPRQQE